MRPSLTQILHACPLHPLSSNSKRAARRSLLAHCDLPSLLALRLVSRSISASTRREETRYFHALRLTLDLRSASSGITPDAWAALARIGHLARRVIITFRSGGARVGFSPENERSPTLNPLPHERRFNSARRFAPVEQQTPLLAGVFGEFEVRADQPCGLFKRVLDLTPNMHSLCIRDGAVWADVDGTDADADADAGWGRTLADEALIFLRCQLEESLLSRVEALDSLCDLHRLEKVRRVREISTLETLAARDHLSRLEHSIVVQIGGLSRLDAAARCAKLTQLRALARDNNLSRLSRLFQLEDSLLSQRAEVARLTAHTQLPKLLELQLGSPLALWHFRGSLPYGSNSSGAWRSVHTLNITLPCATPGGSPSRKRTVKKGIYSFLSEFARTVESLGLGLASTPSTPERTIPLVYDLDRDFGAGEATAYPALRRLVLKNMYLAWNGSLRELLVARAPGCVELVLVGCTWESEDACRELYELFELQNPQRLRNRNVPFVLMRKLALSG